MKFIPAGHSVVRLRHEHFQDKAQPVAQSLGGLPAFLIKIWGIELLPLSNPRRKIERYTAADYKHHMRHINKHASKHSQNMQRRTSQFVARRGSGVEATHLISCSNVVWTVPWRKSDVDAWLLMVTWILNEVIEVREACP